VPGRHRRSLRGRAGVALGAAVVVLAVSAGSWFGFRAYAGDTCSGRLELVVAAAPEIAGAVRDTADAWVRRDRPDVNGTCVAVRVTDAEAGATAAAVAREHRVSLLGVGQAPATVALPHVWIPDSSAWLLRLRAEAAGFVPTGAASVARSPVVLAVPEPAAAQVGGADRKLAWPEVLQRITAADGPRTGIVDPTRDAAGLAALLALGGAAGSDARRKVGMMRTLAANSSRIRADLLQKFPRSAADTGDGIAAAPLSEVDVARYNAAQPPVPLAGLTIEPASTALDYPFAVMPGLDAPEAGAADALQGELRSARFLDALRAAALRAPAGAPAAADRVTAAINQALGSWAAITLPGRQLAVFDVSGSMFTRVPTAGNLTRAEVTQRAAAQGLALLDDRWEVGNWTFATNLAGTRPWRENVPIVPLSSGRQRLQAAIGAIVPKRGGDTGLYDTALAAYRTVRDSWKPGRVNSVVLFTDGRNDNPGGIDRPTLLAELKKLQDPKRPVRMVIIGIGNEVDRGELEAIATATASGGAFIAEDPAKIGDIFLQAIASRSGA
jgi:Ca-activated chloride channel family protein